MRHIKGLCAFLSLVAIIGFPRIYGTEVPMAVLLTPFYIFPFLAHSYRRTSVQFFLFLIFFVAGLFLGFISYLNGGGDQSNLFFHVTLYFKLALVLFFGYAVYRIVLKYPDALLQWFLFQLAAVVSSSLNSDVYRFLLGFISPRSADVFQEIFGLRALGLGLFHVDGAILLVFAAFLLLITKRPGSISSVMHIGISFPISMLIARSAIIPFVLFGILNKGLILKASFIIAVFMMFLLNLFVSSGPLYEALELFRNIASGFGPRMESVEHLAAMYSLPSRFETYLIGDGFYYGTSKAELEFYMSTDIGYLRILYYSGFFSLIIFSALNLIYPASGLLSAKGDTSREFRIYFLVTIVVFFVLNAKGIQSIPILSIAAYYLLIEHRTTLRSRTPRRTSLP